VIDLEDDSSTLVSQEDPLTQFELWFAEASETGVPMPEAVGLATVNSAGRPAVRMVLYKGISDGGLTFFTNYTSRKARHIEGNGHAAMVFHWKPLERQVRIEGSVERLTDEQSDAYFETRSRASQIAATASLQSRPFKNRSQLLARYREIEARFKDCDVSRPDFWGGYRLVPDRVEFWAERPHRLHDRLEYRRRGDGWECNRLQP
jgi:pyridoxamine 5'-phosphate oxidase